MTAENTLAEALRVAEGWEEGRDAGYRFARIAHLIRAAIHETSEAGTEDLEERASEAADALSSLREKQRGDGGNRQAPSRWFPMTPERLNEIQARVNAATHGPWTAITVFAGRSEIYGGDSPAGGELPLFKSSGGDRDEDAEFIAHAREDVPWLLSELARVRAELATANERERQLRDALMMCEDALVDDALDFHEAHVARGEVDAEDCAVCVVASALAVVSTGDRELIATDSQTGAGQDRFAREPMSALSAHICKAAERTGG